MGMNEALVRRFFELEKDDGLPNFDDGIKVYGTEYNLEANLVAFVMDKGATLRDEPCFTLEDFQVSLVSMTWMNMWSFSKMVANLLQLGFLKAFLHKSKPWGQAVESKRRSGPLSTEFVLKSSAFWNKRCSGWAWSHIIPAVHYLLPWQIARLREFLLQVMFTVTSYQVVFACYRRLRIHQNGCLSPEAFVPTRPCQWETLQPSLPLDESPVDFVATRSTWANNLRNQPADDFVAGRNLSCWQRQSVFSRGVRILCFGAWKWNMQQLFVRQSRQVLVFSSCITSIIITPAWHNTHQLWTLIATGEKVPV